MNRQKMTVSAARVQTPTKARSGVLLSVGLIGLVAILLLAAFDDVFAGVVPAAIGFWLALTLTGRRLAPLMLSPAFYFAVVAAFVALAGFFFANGLADAGDSAGLTRQINDELRQRTASAMLTMSALVLIGAAVTHGRSSTAGHSSRLDLGDLSRSAGWFVFIGGIVLVATVYFAGPSQLLVRSDRLMERDSGIETVVMMLALGSVALVSVALFSQRRGVAAVAIVELAGFLTLFFAMSSRRLALFPLLVLLGYILARRGGVPRMGTAVAAGASLLLLVLPLALRHQQEHGVIPYARALPSVQLTSEMFDGAMNNFLAGFRITAITAYDSPSIPSEVLWISLNPGLGDSVGWSEVAGQLRISHFIPYSALGELLNYGLTVALAVSLILGMLLGLLQRLGDGQDQSVLTRLAAVVSMGLVAMAAVSSTQYTLRSVMRYIYLAVLVQLAITLWIKLSANRSSAEPLRPAEAPRPGGSE